MVLYIILTYVVTLTLYHGKFIDNHLIIKVLNLHLRHTIRHHVIQTCAVICTNGGNRLNQKGMIMQLNFVVILPNRASTKDTMR